MKIVLVFIEECCPGKGAAAKCYEHTNIYNIFKHICASIQSSARPSARFLSACQQPDDLTGVCSLAYS